MSLWWRFSYWLRPYDMMLDSRRWRWQESGCSKSRRWVHDVLGQDIQRWLP